jgi:hypothetical protein
MLTFQPLAPKHTAGLSLDSLRIHLRDHKLRDVPVGHRTLEAHYGSFVLSQARKGAKEARRLAIEVSYGRAAREDEFPAARLECTSSDPNPRPTISTGGARPS